MVKRVRLEDLVDPDAEIEVVEREAPEKNKGGRPTTYQPRYAKIAKILCARGAIDRDLADAFGVTTVSIQKWQTRYPEFGAAVREGKAEIFDPMVERTCVQRALGFFMDCEEVKITKDGDIIRYPVRKYFPPDPASIFFWLKNRQPGKWRDVWKIEKEVKIVDSLTSDQLLAEIQKDAEELGLVSSQLKTMGVAPTGKGNGTKH